MDVDFKALSYEQQLEYVVLELSFWMSESDVRDQLSTRSPDQQNQIIEFIYELIHKYTEQTAAAHRRTFPIPARENK